MYRNTSVGSWIARRAHITPNRTALVRGTRRTSYRELDARIRRLAHVLQGLGVRRGDAVALLGPNHPAHIETLFACGLLGAAFVPVHPGFGDEAVTRALREVKCHVLLFTEPMRERVERLRDRIVPRHFIAVDSDAPWATPYETAIAESADDSIDRDVTMSDTCIIGFTSGTTGDNKGVLLSHGNIATNVFNLLSRLDYVRDDVMLVTAPLFRMGGLGFTLPVLFKGGTCVMPESDAPEEALDLIDRHRVTLLFDTPQKADAWRRSPRFCTADLSSIKLFASGGTNVPEDLIDAYQKRGVCLLQGYGLTEAAPVALLLDPADAYTERGAAGRPPLLTSVRIAREDGAETGHGEIGELWVSGPNVMQGYLDRPEATRRALPGDGWLRTGDAAFRNARGDVTIVGRVSEALRIDGATFHPGLLERALCRLPEIAECAVIQNAPEGAPRVFLVAEAGRAPDVNAVLELCRRALPRDWASGDVRVVHGLEKNPNGKIVRERLRNPAARHRPAAGHAVPSLAGT